MTPRVRHRQAASSARLKAAADFDAACTVVGRAHGLDPAAIKRPIEGVHRVGLAARGFSKHEGVRQIARARYEAAYLAVTVFGAKLRALGDVSGVSVETIRNAVKETEERREDPTYDRHLDELELECMA